jgi:hypothetical protein
LYFSINADSIRLHVLPSLFLRCQAVRVRVSDQQILPQNFLVEFGLVHSGKVLAQFRQQHGRAKSRLYFKSYQLCQYFAHVISPLNFSVHFFNEKIVHDISLSIRFFERIDLLSSKEIWSIRLFDCLRIDRA